MRSNRSLRALLSLAATVGAAGLAACGSGSAKPADLGHGSPAAAATGFLEEASAAKTAEACTYVLPTQISECTQALAAGRALSVRNLHTGAVSVVGDRALVTAMGTLCTYRASKICFSNSDANKGQPTALVTFSEAYTAVESGSSAKNDPAVPCAMVGGQWYVDLGSPRQPTGTPPTTSATSPTT